MLCRNMKELRELICVSRLDYHQDDGVNLSASDSEDSFIASSDYNSTSKSPAKQRSSCNGLSISTIDSGNARNLSLSSGFSEADELPLSKCDANQHLCDKMLNSSSVRQYKVLPSLQSVTPPVSANIGCREFEVTASSVPAVSGHESCNFDEIFDAIDMTVVAEWLQEANDIVSRLSKWSLDSEKFVHFAHFWLSKMSGIDRSSLIRLEHEILIDRLSAAFPAEFHVQLHQVRAFAAAVFHEYPRRMLSTGGVFLVLNYLDILTMSQHDQQFCRLLSNIHCSTNHRQHTEIVLAVRAFAIASVLSAFVTFYCKIVGVSETTSVNGLPADVCSSSLGIEIFISEQRMNAAIRNGWTVVVHYLIKFDCVKATFVDCHQRSLLFLAVLHRQPKVLQFLLTHVLCRDVVDVNLAADSGNTPLHAAANIGDTSLVEILLTSRSINVNAINEQADNATPLHLAVMHGHGEVVTRLMAAGADPSLLTGQLSAVDIAREFGQSKLLNALQRNEDA